MDTARNTIISRGFTHGLRAGAFAAFLCAALCGAAHADSKGKGPEKLYKWVDENGIVHYGDRVPAEYSNIGRIEITAG